MLQYTKRIKMGNQQGNLRIGEPSTTVIRALKLRIIQSRPHTVFLLLEGNRVGKTSYYINDIPCKNEIRINNNIAEMDCYDVEKNVVATTVFDIDDIPMISKYRWRSTIKGTKLTNTYIVTNVYHGSTIEVLYLHRLIMSAPKGIEVDHIDGNPLNNQKSNLRFATRSQQLMNTRIRSDNSLGIRGIVYDKRKNTYKIEIQKNNFRYYFKDFDNIAKAAYGRKIAQEILFGEYSSKNQINEDVWRELTHEEKQNIEQYVVNKLREQQCE